MTSPSPDPTPSVAATGPEGTGPSRASQRARRQFDERDRAIRDATRRLLAERGLHGFSMEDVAEAIEYSKGTVYLHYASKEDALVASCADLCAEFAACFERAAAFPGTSRERIAAVAQAHGRHLEERPLCFRSVPILHSPAVLERATPERRAALDVAQLRAIEVCTSIVRDAIRDGDLVLPEGRRPDDIAFVLWALILGVNLLVELHAPAGVLGVTDAASAVRMHWATHLDGLGWAPRPTPEEARTLVERIDRHLRATRADEAADPNA